MQKTDAPLKEAVKGSRASQGNYWIQEIERAREHERAWRGTVAKLLKRYRDEEETDGYRMNIMWANTEVLTSALMPQIPKVDVRRRQNMQDAQGRLVSMVLERAVEYQQDQYDVLSELQDTLQDGVIAGRGVMRIRERPIIGTVPLTVMGQVMGEVEDVIDQRYSFEFVSWQDFVVCPARRWSEVPWIGFRHMLDEDQVSDLFGPGVATKLSYAHTPYGDDDAVADHRRKDNRAKLAEIYEIWDKRNKRRVWVSEGYEGLIDVEDDPYQLQGFWPVPRPLQFIRTSNDMTPVPEAKIIQDQLDELDIITNRIAVLTEALKRRGIFDASMDALKRLIDADDNEFVGVDNFAVMTEKGGLDMLFQEQRLDHMIVVLQQLYQAREQVLGIIYELTGISDIMRGSAADRETATTTRQKASFGSLRLVNRKKELARFIRDAYRIMTEMIAERCDPEILMAQAQVPGVSEETIQLLRSERDRGYRIDVETDETVAYDEAEDKRSRMETFQAIGQFINFAAPLVQSGSLDMEAAKGLITFVMKPYKEARIIEEQLQMLQPPKPQEDKEGQLEAQLAQAEMMKAQVQRQNAAEKAQLEAQVQMMKAQLEQAKTQLKAQEMAQKIGIDVAKLQLEAQKVDLQEMKLAQDQEMREAELTTRIATTNIQGETSRDVARIHTEGRSDGSV